MFGHFSLVPQESQGTGGKIGLEMPRNICQWRVVTS